MKAAYRGDVRRPGTPVKCYVESALIGEADSVALLTLLAVWLGCCHDV